MTGTIPADVRDLLTAIRDAANPNGLDHPACVRRLVTIQVQVDGILSAGRLDTRTPDLPSMVPAVIAAATGTLRSVAGEGEGA